MTTKVIVSTCRKLQCLSTCQKLISSFTSFLRYYILRIPAISLVDNTLAHITEETEFWDMALVVKYQ